MNRKALIVVLILTFLSCVKDNDDVVNTELEGRWVLTSAVCFCDFGENTDFSEHEINFQGSTLDVQNSVEIKFMLNSAGTYLVNGNTITLESGAQYKYVIKNKTLELTFVDNPQIGDDELLLVYLRY